MANTYTQVHIHAIFAVQNRHSMIKASWESELFKYITGIVRKNRHKLIAINGMPDHVHILFGQRPSQSLSDLIQDIKGGSSKWINDNNFVKGRFSWQEGYAAFSYSKNAVPDVALYIQNQKEHHMRKSFSQEVTDLLDEFKINYQHQYLLKAIDDASD